MRFGFARPPIDWQAWLVLSRVATLPTIWSNCLAAWILSEGALNGRIFVLACSASLFYVGGAWLNDYLDLDFDRERRLNRPLALGRLSPETVHLLGTFWLVLGAGLLVLSGSRVVPVLLLLLSALAYNRIHNATTLAPALMGFCRVLLYVVVASASSNGVTGFTLWCAIALGIYSGAVGYVAQTDISRNPLDRWPLALLSAPVVLALLANTEEYKQPAIWLSFILALWVLPCLRYALRAETGNRRLTVSGLRAGIVLVDLLATGGTSPEIIVVFALLFLICVFMQRYLPDA